MILSNRHNTIDISIYNEFLECVQDLTDLEDVQRLADFPQHMNTNRLEHSLNVAFCCFMTCKKLGLDYRSAARAGVLHDLFHYDWTQEKQPEGNHASAHPQVALRNARKNVALNEIEEDAILRHMWPLTLVPPKYKESMLLSFADKYCCMMEVCSHLTNKLHKIVNVYKRVYTGGCFAR